MVTNLLNITESLRTV